jgi:protein-disulfide isomerase
VAKRTSKRGRASRRPQAPPKRQITPTMIAIVAGVALVVVAAVIIFAQQQAAPKPVSAVQQLPSTLDVPTGKTPEGYWYKGNPDAKVTLVEYTDYQCPICKSYYEQLVPQIDEQFVKTGKAKFVYKDFAFIGDESKAAAQAALCAGDQNRFWEYHDLLFKNQGAENSGAFNRDKLIEFATTLDLDTNAFTQCLNSGKYSAQINRSTQEGRNQGVTGTPTTFVDGRKLEGLVNFSDIEAAVNAALGQAQ